MKRNNAKNYIVTIVAVILNIVAIYLVVSSVDASMRYFDQSSFTQNIENIKTLTDSSASKVRLAMDHYRDSLMTTAGYINQYNGVGMTEDEIASFVGDYYTGTDCSWQLINSAPTGADRPSDERFCGVMLTRGGSVAYNVNSYPDHAALFRQASEATLGAISYINEFTDVSTLRKSFAVTSTVRVRDAEAVGGYQYKTLMLVIMSSYINQVIASNNNIDNLDFFDYTNVIIDEEGSYVFSNSSFQGKNILQFLEAYDASFTKAEGEGLLKGLKSRTVEKPIFYKNNREQDCVYTVSPIEDTSWHILSMVPIKSFHNVDNYSVGYIRFMLSLILLFLIDVTFIMLVNRRLRRISKEAQAASIAKSQFLSSMSHDIRTPMNAIIGMTVIAGENLEEETLDRETLKDCVKTIELSGNHLLTLINDILDLSKIESGRVALSPDEFSIAETMSKMLEIMQPQIKSKGFDFETHITNVEHEFVRADELRVNQIFINILSNAVKYTNPGGKIVVELSEEGVRGRSDRARFIYRVSDTGVGMDKEFQKTIFDRFTRAVDTRINRVQGTGLGMSIVKQLVDLMGGTIMVQSELNVGSVFTVTLTLPVADISAQSSSLRGLSALLIDDDQILLDTVHSLLKKAGMQADMITDGQIGISMALTRQQSGSPYDVIMVDWKLSGMNGLHVVQELRARLGPQARIIVMTAYSIADIERDARQAGANAVITKPLFQSKLLHAIQALFVDGGSVQAPEGRPTFSVRVLVAEDNQINWKVMSKLLQRYGITADRAENGWEAVKLVRDCDTLYDLVLMDIQMPVMNGLEAAEKIRRLDDAAKAATPIYAMTADTFAEDVAHCVEKGMNGHLAKPVEVDKLLKVLRQVGGRS